MITNDQELRATKERIEKFESWLEQLRRTARRDEFQAVTSGYRLEIERMQAQVLGYLLQPVTVSVAA